MGHLLNFLLICFYMQCHQRKWCQPGMFSKSHFIISCLFMKLRVWLWCDHHTSFPVLPGERLRINLFFFSLVGLAWVRDPTQAIAVTSAPAVTMRDPQPTVYHKGTPSILFWWWWNLFQTLIRSPGTPEEVHFWYLVHSYKGVFGLGGH